MDNNETSMPEAAPMGYEKFPTESNNTSMPHHRHRIPTILFTLFLIVIIPTTIWAVATNRLDLRNWAASATRCWNTVLEQNGVLYWPNGCLGTPPTNHLVCTEALVELTATEQLQYRRWIKLRRLWPECEMKTIKTSPSPGLPSGCFKKPIHCIMPPCDPIIVCPPFEETMTPDPRPSCIPFPTCINEPNGVTRCAQGLPPDRDYCFPTITPDLRPSCVPRLKCMDDPDTSKRCYPDVPPGVTICPPTTTMTPDPRPTCIPRPPCMDTPEEGEPYCDPYIPPGGWICPDGVTPTTSVTRVITPRPTNTPYKTPAPLPSRTPTPTQTITSPVFPTTAPTRLPQVQQPKTTPFRSLLQKLFPFFFLTLE